MKGGKYLKPNDGMFRLEVQKSPSGSLIPYKLSKKSEHNNFEFCIKEQLHQEAKNIQTTFVIENTNEM